MITKNEIKFVKALQQKKTRQKEGLFFVEGAKSVLEAIQSGLKVYKLYCTEAFLEQVPKPLIKSLQWDLCAEKDLIAMGTFESNNAALVILYHKKPEPLSDDDLVLVLDDISDPGNLGTIIRTADWFGIKDIVCSPHTTDFYSPKVISATMGSFTRINIIYQDLEAFFKSNKRPVYGAFLGGTPLGVNAISTPAVLVIGNEAKGISKEVAQYVDYKVTIPGQGAAESLNASIAAAILMYEIKG